MMPLVQVTQSHAGVKWLDGGRQGAAALGFCKSGVLDVMSAWLAHALVGHHIAATEYRPELFYQIPACVEITAGNCEFTLLTALRFAHCGAQGPLLLNDKAIPTGCAVDGKAGDVIRVGFYRHGCRGYLAFGADMATEPHARSYGSCIALTPDGKTPSLLQGHELTGRPTPSQTRPYSLAYNIQAALVPPPVLTLDYLPMAASFDATALHEQLSTRLFKVSAFSDRMGIRTIGDSLWCDVKQVPMYSEALSLGTIQLPPDGQPIILANDHQTIGGYPRLGTVASYSLYALAQQRPGQFIRFQAVDLPALQHKRDLCWYWLWQQLAKVNPTHTVD